MGETCSMRLVNQNLQDTTECKLCQKLGTKIRRRNAEAKRYETWRQEGRLGQLCASAENCLEMIHDLDREIEKLQAERMRRDNDNCRELRLERSNTHQNPKQKLSVNEVSES
jgi:hypothetical protein